MAYFPWIGAAPRLAGCRRRRMCNAAGLGLLLLAMVGAAGAADDLPSTLARLDALAGRSPTQAQRELDAVLSRQPQLDDRSRLRVELIRAQIADTQYKADEVLKIYERVRDRLKALDDPELGARFEHLHASGDFELGRFDEGWAALDEELRQARRADDEDLIAFALAGRVRYCVRRNDYQGAASAIAQAEHHVRGPRAAAEVAFADGILAKNVGDFEQTLHANQDARARFNEVDDHTGVADALANIGEAYVNLGRPAEALAPLEEAVRLYREIGDHDGEALALLSHAGALDRLGRYPLALEYAQRATAILARESEPWHLAQGRVMEAELMLRDGRAGEASRLMDESRSELMSMHDLSYEAQWHDVNAQVLAAMGRDHDAYLELRLGRDAARGRTEQLVKRQLAVQRGRLESARLNRENELLRLQAESDRKSIESASLARRYERIALALGAVAGLGALLAIWRQRTLLRRIERLAAIDELTDMLNRRKFVEVGQRAIARCQHDGKPCALLMIDIDRFKQINDRHGHAAGDAALRAVSATLKKGLRPNDVIGRYGGEEFAIVLPGASMGEARIVGDRLRLAVADLEPAWAAGAEPLTISEGIVVVDVGNGERAELGDLLARADEALYRAKNTGRNRIEFADAGVPAVVQAAS